MNKILQKAKWKGQDSFPSDALWENEHENWLSYIDNKGWLDKYMPRLTKMDTKKRDEAFCEISSMYFLEKLCGFFVSKLEPISGANGMIGDFILNVDDIGMFCEVKSPGWEADFVKEQGPNSPRLNLPKYINAEARGVDNSLAICYAVDKAYNKIPDNVPSLLIINDDLWFSILDEIDVDGMPICIYRALYYEPHKSPYTDSRLPGYFMSDKYKNLSGILFIRVINSVKEDKIIYKKILSINSNAQYQLPQKFTNKLENFNRNFKTVSK